MITQYKAIWVKGQTKEECQANVQSRLIGLPVPPVEIGAIYPTQDMHGKDVFEVRILVEDLV